MKKALSSNFPASVSSSPSIDIVHKFGKLSTSASRDQEQTGLGSSTGNAANHGARPKTKSASATSKLMDMTGGETSKL